jgi:bacteriocin-like protein
LDREEGAAMPVKKKRIRPEQPSKGRPAADDEKPASQELSDEDLEQVNGGAFTAALSCKFTPQGTK